VRSLVDLEDLVREDPEKDGQQDAREDGHREIEADHLLAGEPAAQEGLDRFRIEHGAAQGYLIYDGTRIAGLRALGSDQGGPEPFAPPAGYWRAVCSRPRRPPTRARFPRPRPFQGPPPS